MVAQATLNPYKLFNRLGFVYTSFPGIKAEKKASGEWKKIPIALPKWGDMNDSFTTKSHKGCAIRTGETSNLTVIDIDDPTTTVNKQLMDIINPQCNMIVKTRKGFHYYFLYDLRIGLSHCNDFKLDILSDKTLVFAPPTVSVNDGEGNILCKYEFIKIPDNDASLVEIPQLAIDLLLNIAKVNRHPNSPVAPVAPVSPVTPLDEIPIEITQEIRHTPNMLNDPAEPTDELSLLIKVIDALPEKYITNYSDWLKIGLVLFNEGGTVSQWDILSKRAKNYESNSCSIKWATFSKSNIKTNIIKGASLWYWLKISNPTAFWELMPKRDDLMHLIESQNHNDTAKYFFNMYPDDYLWSNETGWYEINNFNVWKSHGDKPPVSLLRKIADTMQTQCNDMKKMELTRYANDVMTVAPKDAKELLSQHFRLMKLIQNAYNIYGSTKYCDGSTKFLTTYYNVSELMALMDTNINFFAFNDKVFDCSTGITRLIKPNDYISTTTGYDYPIKKNDVIRKEINDFLFTLFENNEQVSYMLMIIASCLSGINRFEEFYTLLGKGSNGKSLLFMTFLKGVFGNYHYTVNENVITKTSDKPDSTSPALIECRNKRMVVINEPESNGTIQMGLIKKLTGGDFIECRTLNQRTMTRYVASFIVFILANSRLKLSGKIDVSISRRLRSIEFPFTFTTKEITNPLIERVGDPDMKSDKLVSDAWRNEMILLLIDIYTSKVKGIKFIPIPKDVEIFTQAYLDASNPVKVWFNINYVITKQASDKILASVLRTSYVSDKGLSEPIKDQWFATMMEEISCCKISSKKGMVYTGIKRIDTQIEIEE